MSSTPTTPAFSAVPFTIRVSAASRRRLGLEFALWGFFMGTNRRAKKPERVSKIPQAGDGAARSKAAASVKCAPPRNWQKIVASRERKKWLGGG
jgi:hypothetical protein